MIRVVIIEDDIKIMESVNVFLQASTDIDIKVVGMFESVEEFKESAASSSIVADVVLLDIVFPGISGIDAIRFIKDKWPQAGIIMFSIMDDGQSIFRSLCEGAVGYLTKEFTLEGLQAAIVDVHEGRGSMSPSIARKVAEYFHPKKKFESSLTDREVDIVNGIIAGLSYKMLADKLSISIDTVRSHIKNVYKKLHINSRAQLVNRYHNN